MKNAYTFVTALFCVMTLAGATGCRHKVTLQEVPASEIETTLFLIGDAGEPDPRQVGSPLDSLTAQVAAAPERSIVVFLGDNVYPDGIPEEGAAEWADARRRLEAQVRAIPQGARAVFVPGNHDWANATAFGLYSIRLQEQMIASLSRGRNVRLLPGNGCPGPVTMDVGRLRLVALDTQWWLHGFIVRDSVSNCPTNTMGAVTAACATMFGNGKAGCYCRGHHPSYRGAWQLCGVTDPFGRFGGRAGIIRRQPHDA